jgi:hypothetical protein
VFSDPLKEATKIEPVRLQRATAVSGEKRGGSKLVLTRRPVVVGRQSVGWEVSSGVMLSLLEIGEIHSTPHHHHHPDRYSIGGLTPAIGDASSRAVSRGPLRRHVDSDR